MTSFRRISRQSTALLAAGALAFGVAACDVDEDPGTDAPAEDPAMDDDMDDPAMDDDMDDDMDMDDDLDDDV